MLCLSVDVSKLQVAIIAPSSREVSHTVRINWKHIMSRVRVSVRPSYFLYEKNTKNYREYRVAHLLTYFSRPLLPSASSGYTIGRVSFTQLLTSIIEIPISLYHLGTSSSHRFRGLPLGRRPPGCITSDLLWGAVGAILLMCDHHLILFLLAVCCAGCMFTRRLISSFLILSILVFHAAFLRHLISVVVNICLSLLVRVQFSLW